MIQELTREAASQWFEELPPDRRIATLSPAYVCADSRRDPQLVPVFALYADERGFWLHGAHLCAIPGSDRFDIQSPYGYGGPVSNCDRRPFRQDAWTAYCDWCKGKAVAVEFLRLHPLAPWHIYPGRIVNDRQTVMIDLAGKSYRDGYEIRCRTAVRKAEKSRLTVQSYPAQAVVDRFGPFYREGMTRLGASPFYLFGNDYFSDLAKTPGIQLLVCEHEGDWVSAGLFLKGGDGLEYHLSATTPEGRKMSATNLLIDAAAELGTKQGLAWLYLGGGTDARADNSLLKFKAGFSPLRRVYSYGFHVHDPLWYELMRMKSGAAVSRVLFYR